MTETPDNYERRYTGRHPKVAHLLHDMEIGQHSANQWYTVACGLSGDMWQGTGSQDEYETAEELPICQNCLLRIAQDGQYKVWELREFASGMPGRHGATREELMAWLQENKPKVFEMITGRNQE